MNEPVRIVIIIIYNENGSCIMLSAHKHSNTPLYYVWHGYRMPEWLYITNYENRNVFSTRREKVISLK